ncbi:hypothetical protein [Hamadaea tsunoensis]|nr:hypothetical protein [Hamadaea tsunoensis]
MSLAQVLIIVAGAVLAFNVLLGLALVISWRRGRRRGEEDF